MKLLFENWRKYLKEEEEYADLPSAGKYKVTMPLKDIYKIFMETIEENLEVLGEVADDPKKLAAKLTDFFKPEELNVTFKVSEERFDSLGDGAFLHGGVSDPTKTPEGELPTVEMILNKYTGEAIKNWNEPMEISGKGFISARTTTGRGLMAFTVRSTVIHEFVHQAQSQDKDINTESGTDELWKRLGELVGASSEDENFGEHMMPFIDRQTSQKFLDEKNKSEDDKEIRDIVNKVYYSNEQEFTGWAQGAASDLIDMAMRGLIPNLKGRKGEQLKRGVVDVFDDLIKNANQGVPKEIAKENAALRFYGHPEGFMATYGQPGYKAFLQIAKGYAEKYSESVYGDVIT